MALLETTPPEKAEGKLAELYAEIEQMFGAVPNNARMLGVSPPILENQIQIIEHYREHATLSFPLLALIRLLVSKGCKSPYCQGVNTHLLMQQGYTEEQIKAIMQDPSAAPLEEKEKAMLAFVLKGTDDPHAVNAADIERLKTMGWSEQDIFDALAHGARMVGTNILFDAFKIDRDQFPGS